MYKVKKGSLYIKTEKNLPFYNVSLERDYNIVHVKM